MADSAQNSGNTHFIITLDGLRQLFDALKRRGYRVLGPTVHDGAIVYDDIGSPADMPRGWTDDQQGGHYRLLRRDDEALFGYAVGPHSWKRFLHPPLLTLWRAERVGPDMRISTDPPPLERYAFLA